MSFHNGDMILNNIMQISRIDKHVTEVPKNHNKSKRSFSDKITRAPRKIR